MTGKLYAGARNVRCMLTGTQSSKNFRLKSGAWYCLSGPRWPAKLAGCLNNLWHSSTVLFQSISEFYIESCTWNTHLVFFLLLVSWLLHIIFSPRSNPALGIKLSFCYNDCTLLLNRVYFTVYFNETTLTQSPTKKCKNIWRNSKKKIQRH